MGWTRSRGQRSDEVTGRERTEGKRKERDGKGGEWRLEERRKQEKERNMKARRKLNKETKGQDEEERSQ